MIEKTDFLLGGFGIVGSPCRNPLLVSDCVNQVGLTGDGRGDFSIAQSYAVLPVGIAASEMRLPVSISQSSCLGIGLGRFAGVKGFKEIKLLTDGRPFFSGTGIGKTQEAFTTGMGRTENSSKIMNNLNENRHREPPDFNQRNFYTGGHDHKNMPCIKGVVLDSF